MEGMKMSQMTHNDSSLPDLWDIYDLNDDELRSVFSRVVTILSKKSEAAVQQLFDAVKKELQERGETEDVLNALASAPPQCFPSSATAIARAEQLEPHQSDDVPVHGVLSKSPVPAAASVSRASCVSSNASSSSSFSSSPANKAASKASLSTPLERASTPYQPSRRLWDSSSSSSSSRSDDGDDNNDASSGTQRRSRDKSASSASQPSSSSIIVLDNDELTEARKRFKRRRSPTIINTVMKRDHVSHRLYPVSSSLTAAAASAASLNIGGSASMMCVSFGGGRRTFDRRRRMQLQQQQKSAAASCGASKPEPRHQHSSGGKGVRGGAVGAIKNLREQKEQQQQLSVKSAVVGAVNQKQRSLTPAVLSGVVVAPTRDHGRNSAPLSRSNSNLSCDGSNNKHEHKKPKFAISNGSSNREPRAAAATAKKIGEELQSRSSATSSRVSSASVFDEQRSTPHAAVETTISQNADDDDDDDDVFEVDEEDEEHQEQQQAEKLSGSSIEEQSLASAAAVSTPSSNEITSKAALHEQAAANKNDDSAFRVVDKVESARCNSDEKKKEHFHETDGDKRHQVVVTPLVEEECPSGRAAAAGTVVSSSSASSFSSSVAGEDESSTNAAPDALVQQTLVVAAAASSTPKLAAAASGSTSSSSLPPLAPPHASTKHIVFNSAPSVSSLGFNSSAAVESTSKQQQQQHQQSLTQAASAGVKSVTPSGVSVVGTSGTFTIPRPKITGQGAAVAVPHLRAAFPNAASLFVATATLQLVTPATLFDAIECVRANVEAHLQDMNERKKAGGDLHFLARQQQYRHQITASSGGSGGGVDDPETTTKTAPSSSSNSNLTPTFFRVQRNRDELYDLIRDVCETRVDPYWIEVGESQHCGWNLWWNWSRPLIREHYWLSVQKLNRIPQSSVMASKRLLVRSLTRASAAANKASSSSHSPFSGIIPESFRLPGEFSALIESAYGGNYSDSNSSSTSSHDGVSSAGMWIVKPVGQSRGRGIMVLNDLTKLLYNTQVVVQRYVDRPLVVHGRKVDLRIYVVVTGVNPLEAFISRLGFVRFAMKPYPVEELAEESVARRRNQKMTMMQQQQQQRDVILEQQPATESVVMTTAAAAAKPSVNTVKQKSLLQKYKNSLDSDDVMPSATTTTTTTSGNKQQNPSNDDRGTKSNSKNKNTNNDDDDDDDGTLGIITCGEGLCDPFVHLTNTSVANEFLAGANKKSNFYSGGGAISGGSNTKWSLKQLAQNWDAVFEEQLLRKQRREEQKMSVRNSNHVNNNKNTINDDPNKAKRPPWSKVWGSICETVLRVLAASEPQIPAFHRSSAFELFGFDVLLDENAHPWVLEVNSSPSMDRVSPLDEEVKPQLLDEILSLVQPTSVDFQALHEILLKNGASSTTSTASSSSSLAAAAASLSHASRVGGAAWDSVLNKIFPAGVAKTPLERVSVFMSTLKQKQQPQQQVIDSDDELFGCVGAPRFEEFLQLAPSSMYNTVVKQRRGGGGGAKS